jgi:hypothetical protein
VRTRVQGADHPDTLTTRHLLARWAGQAGDGGWWWQVPRCRTAPLVAALPRVCRSTGTSLTTGPAASAGITSAGRRPSTPWRSATNCAGTPRTSGHAARSSSRPGQRRDIIEPLFGTVVIRSSRECRSPHRAGHHPGPRPRAITDAPAIAELIRLCGGSPGGGGDRSRRCHRPHLPLGIPLPNSASSIWRSGLRGSHCQPAHRAVLVPAPPHRPTTPGVHPAGHRPRPRHQPARRLPDRAAEQEAWDRHAGLLRSRR